MNLELIKNLLSEEKASTDVFKRNIASQYLQVLALDFIYRNPKYQNLVFYGGSCLKHCYGLNRLSEDLDFVDIKKNIDIEELAEEIKKYFKKDIGLEIKTKIQKFRVYLKFPILFELGLAKQGESDFLFLKIEIFKGFDSCEKKAKIEILPLFKHGKSVLIRAFNLSTLMSTKIRAVLQRKWEQSDKQGNVIIKVKGRDYFDLMWYLNKGVEPNLDCIKEIKDIEALKIKLINQVKKIDQRSIQLDLLALIKDAEFVENLSKNIKDILIDLINSKL
ncbi:hypothetical protein A2Y83_02195 [Candidatus Falkowbacteria bacterium RBG_13_39_14]|uniref:Nucleotidyl transferase AbiEii/AbiGii toxin family protein n=1 Tax=Candidatus Falkowbacteria bacterium RBG_13_39_14 TaxID=1797985 RepID=A0A1F5S245_9BACT|nr:MAG: hypothetical protein A2Y83_02195 [Candidatus Falkowbacteria bacterium RBG_13_39_14]